MRPQWLSGLWSRWLERNGWAKEKNSQVLIHHVNQNLCVWFNCQTTHTMFQCYHHSTSSMDKIATESQTGPACSLTVPYYSCFCMPSALFLCHTGRTRAEKSFLVKLNFVWLNHPSGLSTFHMMEKTGQQWCSVYSLLDSFPGVIWSVDCTHHPTKAPLQDAFVVVT